MVGWKVNWEGCERKPSYLLTPWCRVLLEKLTGLQLVKKFPAFHGTRRFIYRLLGEASRSIQRDMKTGTWNARSLYRARS